MRTLIFLFSCSWLTSTSEHTKQTDQGWGAPTGESEWNDEKAGDAIAKDEVKEGGWDAGGAPGLEDGKASAPGWDANNSGAPGWDGGDSGAPGFTDSAAPAESGAGENSNMEPIEPEDTNKSYADYLAEQATKKMEGLGVLEPRRANEGAKQDKKWKNAKELTKTGDDEEYFQRRSWTSTTRLRNQPVVVVKVGEAVAAEIMEIMETVETVENVEAVEAVETVETAENVETAVTVVVEVADGATLASAVKAASGEAVAKAIEDVANEAIEAAEANIAVADVVAVTARQVRLHRSLWTMSRPFHPSAAGRNDHPANARKQSKILSLTKNWGIQFRYSIMARLRRNWINKIGLLSFLILYDNQKRCGGVQSYLLHVGRL